MYCEVIFFIGLRIGFIIVFNIFLYLLYGLIIIYDKIVLIII